MICFGPSNSGVLEDFAIGDAHIVRPKVMVLCGLRRREALQDCGYGQRIRITGTCHDAGRAVFRDWARSPAVLKLCSEPSSGGGMSNVVAMEKRNQDIDVEEITPSVRILFPKPLDLLVRHQPTSAFKRYEAPNSGTS